MGLPAKKGDRAPGEGFLALWAGSMEIRERDAQVELRRAGVRVEIAAIENLTEHVNARAPDLVVLGGEAAEHTGALVNDLIAGSPSASIPIVALSSRDAAEPKPRSRFGLVARLDREVDPPALAAQIRHMIEALSARPAVWRVPIMSDDGLAGEARGLARAGRSGLLVAEGAGAMAVDAQQGVPHASMDSAAPSTHALFHERAPGRLRVIAALGPSNEEPVALAGARVLLIDDDEGRRDRTALALERAGAEVKTTAALAKGVYGCRALDPAAIVVAAPALAKIALAPLWSEPRLAVAALLVLDGEALVSGSAAALAVEIGRSMSAELRIAARLRSREGLADRLETIGPARWLKLLGRCEGTVSLRAFSAAGRVRVDLFEGRIRGASFYRAGGSDVVDGRPAVDALMAMPFGRVLAGPPDAITMIEGLSANRKLSAVGLIGQLAPAPASPPRVRGLVVEELVVKATDATHRAMESSPPRAPAVSRGVFDDDDDDDDGVDDATSTYSAQMAAELRAASAGAPRAERVRTPSNEPAVARGGATHRADERKSGAKSDPHASELPVLAPSDPRRSPDPSAASLSAAGAAASERAEVGAPLVVLKTAPATPVRSAGRLLLAVMVAIVLAVGGWAAWRLHGADAPGASTPARVAPALAPEPGVDPEPIDPEPIERSAESIDAVVEPPIVAVPADDPPETPPEPAPTAVADASALIRSAIEAARARQYVRSEALCRQALALSPRDARAGYRLAVALYRQERDEDALTVAREASEWQPDDPMPVVLIGDIESHRGRFATAARAYRLALERSPSFGPAQRGLERVLARGAAAP